MSSGTLVRSKRHGIIVDQSNVTWLHPSLFEMESAPVHRQLVQMHTGQFVAVTYEVGAQHPALEPSAPPEVRRVLDAFLGAVRQAMQARSELDALRAKVERLELALAQRSTNPAIHADQVEGASRTANAAAIEVFGDRTEVQVTAEEATDGDGAKWYVSVSVHTQAGQDIVELERRFFERYVTAMGDKYSADIQVVLYIESERAVQS
jgi:hypothetical protein